MGREYTPEEQELISSLREDKLSAGDLERAAELLVARIGDMSFNTKLGKDKTPEPTSVDPDNPTPAEQQAIEQYNNDHSTKEFLSYFTFKTRNMGQFEAIAQKLDVVTELQTQKLPISENEKITLSEYNKIASLQSLSKNYEDILEAVAQNSSNEKFQALYDNMTKSSDIIETLEEKALDTKDYKSGDLMMYLSSKTSAVKGRQQLSGHEGKLEDIFITKYNHVAPIYTDRRDSDKPITTKSDVWSEQRADALELGEILESDAVRIDPTKLVDAKRIKQLETIDYGYKKDQDGNDITDDAGNKIKTTWQEAMHLRYEQLSDALHIGQLAYQIEEQESKQEILGQKSTELKEEIADLESEIEYLQELLDDQQDYLDDISEILEEMPKNSKARKKIIQKQKEDQQEYDELTEEIQDKTDEKDLLEAEREEKDTAYEELEKAIGDKQDLIIKNDKERLGAGHWLHPKTVLEGHTQWMSQNDFRELSQKMFDAEPLKHEQLLNDLAKELQNPDKIDTEFQKELEQIRDFESGKSDKLSPMTALPKKLYNALKNSQDEAEFKGKGTQVVEEYLKATGSEQSVIDDVKIDKLPEQLAQAFKKKDVNPKELIHVLQKTSLDAVKSCYNKSVDDSRNEKLLINIKDSIKSSTLGRQDMICSEFSARSIVSVIDQLNKLTALDLVAAGITDKEAQVVKSPISKRENFTNLHPERLADILEKSGCTTPVVNSYLKDLVQLENTDKAKSKTKAIDYTAALPKKLYSVLKDSKSEAEFKETATKVTEIYLKAAKVEPDVIGRAKGEVLSGQLDNIYQEHTKQPKGIIQKINKACIKVIEYCGLRTKDKSAKQNLDNMIKDIKKSEELEKKKSKEKDPANLSTQDQAKLIGNKLKQNSVIPSTPSSNSSQKFSSAKKKQQENSVTR